MDTISSRESNSMLPLGGVIVGVVALILGAYSTISLSKVKAQLQTHEDKLSKVDDIANAASAAQAAADKVNGYAVNLAKQTQDGFNQLAAQIADVKGDVTKMQEAHKAPAAGKGGPKEAVTAGPGEYVVKGGDSLSKIARAHGCTLGELEAVNPGVDSAHLKVGQKIKLPSSAKQQ